MKMYREWQLSGDYAFLRKTGDRLKKYSLMLGQRRDGMEIKME